MNFKNLSILAAAALLIAAAPMSAALISVAGGPSSGGDLAAIIAAPSSVGDNGFTAEAMRGFDEQQDFELTGELGIDAGSGAGGGSANLAIGTIVDSHMIFLNSATAGGTSGLSHNNVTWTFDSEIIGVMSDQGGALEAASNGQLGADGTSYPGALGFRGLELAAQPVSGDPDFYMISADRKSITINMFVTQPGDWMRVVTEAPENEIPEPGTIFLFGAGLLGAAFMRRRKQS